MRHESEGLWGLKSAADALVSYRPLGNYLDRGKDAIRAPLALPEHGLSFHVTAVTASRSETARKELCSFLSSTALRRQPPQQQNAQARLLLPQSY